MQRNLQKTEGNRCCPERKRVHTLEYKKEYVYRNCRIIGNCVSNMTIMIIYNITNYIITIAFALMILMDLYRFIWDDERPTQICHLSGRDAGICYELDEGDIKN